MNWYKTIKLSASQGDIQALSILDNNNDTLNQIKSISPESKYVPIIAYFYKNNNINLNTLKNDIRDYKNFIDKKQLPLVDIRRDGAYLNNEKIDYLHLQEMIHRQRDYKKYIQEEKNKNQLSQDLVPIISKNNITVYESFSRERCINLGKGQTFCISNPQISQNMYQSYRDTRSSSFYFVFDKNREDSDPLSLVVVDITSNWILLTDKTNNTGVIKEFGNDSGKYFEYLESKGISRDIFKHNPKTEEELKEQIELGIENIDLSWFANLSMDYKKKYIGRGHKLTEKQFKYLFDHKLDEFIKLYISLGHRLEVESINLLRNNREYFKTYLRARLILQENRIDLSVFEYSLLDDKQKDEFYRMCFEAVKKNGFYLKDIPEEVKIQNPDICSKAVEYDAEVLFYVPEEVQLKHPEICLKVVEKDGIALCRVPESVQDKHPEICLKAIENNCRSLKYISESVQNKYPEICAKAVEKDTYCFRLISGDIKIKNYKLCLISVKKDAYNLQYVPKEVQIEHPEICFEAIRKDPNSLCYVYTEAQEKNPKICFEAVEICSDVLNYVADEIQMKYPEICMNAIERDGGNIAYVRKDVQIKYPELCFKAVKESEYNLVYIKKEFHEKYPELCIELAGKSSHYLRYVPEKVQAEHPEVCLKAVENYGLALEFVKENIKIQHPEICAKAVEENSNAFEYVPYQVKKKYPELCFKAVEEDIYNLRFVPEEVKDDKSFMEKVNRLKK